jgi:TusA-related sulfurtransferase
MGAALSAFLLGALQLYWKQPIHQYLAVFCGGVTLGLAARMTPACNVWHSHMNDSPDAGHIIELDIRGQICPSSLLMALKKVNEHAARIRNKEVRLCILTDNRQATASIPKAAGNMGHKVTVEKHNGYYEVRSGEPDPPR